MTGLRTFFMLDKIMLRSTLSISFSFASSCDTRTSQPYSNHEIGITATSLEETLTYARKNFRSAPRSYLPFYLLCLKAFIVTEKLSLLQTMAIDSKEIDVSVILWVVCNKKCCDAIPSFSLLSFKLLNPVQQTGKFHMRLKASMSPSAPSARTCM